MPPSTSPLPSSALRFFMAPCFLPSFVFFSSGACPPSFHASASSSPSSSTGLRGIFHGSSPPARLFFLPLLPPIPPPRNLIPSKSEAPLCSSAWVPLAVGMPPVQAAA
ncbi:hypothetical protein T484DRAFT_1935451 [Baffinella frigidus]|nr:hypothetical protein T484DRAFT_1935451 [Cryptophyta sp. CCMP2293]